MSKRKYQTTFGSDDEHLDASFESILMPMPSDPPPHPHPPASPPTPIAALSEWNDFFSFDHLLEPDLSFPPLFEPGPNLSLPPEHFEPDFLHHQWAFDELNVRKKKVGAPLMSIQECDSIIPHCGRLWKRGVSFEISKEHFIFQGLFCEIKDSALDLFQMFPWFRARGIRFRQLLKDDPSKGPTIEEVIRSFNFFFRKLGTFTHREINHILRYCRKVPTASNCLTKIIELYFDFTNVYSGDDILISFINSTL
jgi:hypothetical protein